MKLHEMLSDLYKFLRKLKIQTKCLSDEKFNELLKDKELDYMQKLYLCYFRYM